MRQATRRLFSRGSWVETRRIAELAFGAGSGRNEDVKVAALAGSLLAAALATVLLWLRNPAYRHIQQADLEEPAIK
jgi:hypothetical protein